jgi:hypothetical protein
MSGFDAGTAVEPLQCKLKPFADYEGTIKEPSDDQIKTFINDLTEFYKSVSDDQKAAVKAVESADPDDVLEALNTLDLGAQIDMIGKMSEAYSRLCSGKPTAAQIQKLPLRHRAAFFAWIQGEVVRPEAGPGAGNGQVVTLRTERAG